MSVIGTDQNEKTIKFKEKRRKEKYTGVKGR